MNNYVLTGDRRSPQRLLEAGRYFAVGKHAQGFVDSHASLGTSRFRWSPDSGGDRTLCVFDLPYAPTPRMLGIELRARGLRFPREEDALRFGAMLAADDARPNERAFAEGEITPRKEPGSVLFYHEENLWRSERIYGALCLDLMRGSFRRVRCVPVPPEHAPERIMGDCRFAGIQR